MIFKRHGAFKNERVYWDMCVNYGEKGIVGPGTKFGWRLKLRPKFRPLTPLDKSAWTSRRGFLRICV